MEATQPVIRRRRERQFRTMEEKRLIVEETRCGGVSVAAVAQAHGVNANQVFYWRKLYEAGQLESRPVARRDLEAARMRLLPVSIDGGAEPQLAVTDSKAGIDSAQGSIELTLARGQVRIAGSVDAGTLRTVLRYLLA